MVTQLALRVFERVVFVDWNGVLSQSKYWESLTQRAKRRERMHELLLKRLQEVFVGNPKLGDSWMRGQAATTSLFESVRDARGPRRTEDFLERRLFEECLTMDVDAALTEALARLKLLAPVILATDNTEDFAVAFDRARGYYRNFTPGTSTAMHMTDVARHVDEIICSSRTGVLKAENPELFYGSWLERHHLGFPDALLIDDRDDNLSAFAARGGYGLKWVPGHKNETIISSAFQWARSGTRH